MAKEGARRGRGFRQTGGLVARQIRRVSESRGFAETRLLTDWAAICGPELAAKVTPVRVHYGKGGLGATLIVLCDGARAPEVAMSAETIRARVNACYGYNAIVRGKITQPAAGRAAPTGFSEDPPQFAGKPEPTRRPETEATVRPVADEALREALRTLGDNILSRSRDRSRKDRP